MARRTYAQYCPAARALDVIGERWALLVVRELLLGPKRYTDLLEGLPGIGPNVLAERLKHLQESGIVRRAALPPPAASTVYELTELGAELRPVVLELARWGFNVMGTPRAGDRFRFGWLLTALQTGFDREAARGVRESYEFRIEGETFHVRVEDGTVEARHGPAPDAACVFGCDLRTFLAVGAGLLTPGEAVAAGAAAAEGDLEAGRRSLQILGAVLGDRSAAARLLLWVVTSQLAAQNGSPPDARFELRIGDSAFHVESSGDGVEVTEGPLADAPASVHTDLATFLALGAGADAHAARGEGRLRLAGDPLAGERALELLVAREVPQQRAA